MVSLSEKSTNIWNPDAYDRGALARVAGRALDTAPLAQDAGVWSNLSWKAGWTETDAAMRQEAEDARLRGETTCEMV